MNNTFGKWNKIGWCPGLYLVVDIFWTTLGFLLPSHSNFVSKMHRSQDMTTYWSKIAEKTQATLIWHVPLG